MGSLIALAVVYLAARLQAEAMVKVSNEAKKHKRSEEKQLVLSMTNLALQIMREERQYISRDKKTARRLTENYFVSDWLQFHSSTAHLGELIDSLTPQNIGETAFSKDFLEFKGKLLYIVNRLKKSPIEKVEYFRSSISERKDLHEVRRAELLIERIEGIIRSLSGDVSELEGFGDNLIKSLEREGA